MLRRWLASAGIACYLATLGTFFTWHAAGDWGVHPVAYFFTWDMFPSFYTESLRRLAVGRTADGRFVQVYPGPFDRYRGGVGNDLPRGDLDRSGNSFRLLATKTVDRTRDAHRDDPIVHVYLLERCWPEKFNLPADLYESWWGGPRPDRSCWRLREEFDSP